MRRRIVVVCLAFVLAMLNIVGISAAERQERQYTATNVSQMCPEEIAFREEIGMTEDPSQEFSPYISLSTTVGLDISSSGDAMCSSTVSGDDDIKKIQVFLYLQKNSTGTNVTSWMAQENGDDFGMVRHHQLEPKGITYIVKASIYVQYQDNSYDNWIRYSHTDSY